MSDEFRWLLLCLGFVVVMGLLIGTCVSYGARIDAAAPVVETCIKHPVTRSPFPGAP